MDISAAQEEAFVTAFIVPMKRERWTMLLPSKRRGRLLNELNDNGPAHLERRFALECDEQGLLRVIADLEKLTPKEGVFLISDCAGLDRRILPLVDAIRQVGQQGFGSIFSIVPGRLAFWVSERPNPLCWVLVKDDAERDRLSRRIRLTDAKK